MGRTKVNSMKRKKKHKLKNINIFNFLWFISKKLKSSSKIKISSTVCYTPKNYSLLFITFFKNTFPFFIFKKNIISISVLPLHPSDNLYDKIPTLSDIYFF